MGLLVTHRVQGLRWLGYKGVMVSGMFPYGAFEMLREENPVFSTLFGHSKRSTYNLSIHGQATTASTEYVTGARFFAAWQRRWLRHVSSTPQTTIQAQCLLPQSVSPLV